jgi:hypothetical protein
MMKVIPERVVQTKFDIYVFFTLYKKAGPDYIYILVIYKNHIDITQETRARLTNYV